MTAQPPHDRVYGWMLELARDAFIAGHEEPAYSALVAAYELARQLRDPDRLTTVARIAEAQLAWMDAHTPTSLYSTATAQATGQPSEYSMLAQQAHKWARLLEWERQS